MKSQMQNDAISIYNQELRLGRLNVYSREYELAMDKLAIAQDDFRLKYGKSDVEVYNEMVTSQ